MESRLNEIEVKLSFAEDQIEALNHTVFRQQQLIEQLQQELRTLRQQMQAGSSPLGNWSLKEEVPPHY